ncbi:MAG: type III secretion system chaperone family protein [Mycobacteriales bacterium]
MTSARRGELEAVIAAALDGARVAYEQAGGGFLATLPGQHKLATLCWLVVGDHSLLVEAFVMRRPDEGHERLYHLLLRRNSRMYGVHWSLDDNGDVFLVGRVALEAVTPEEIDRLLGSVLCYADETFDLLLEIGFAGSIRREWAWRVSRGESTANLAAFARFAGPEPEAPAHG